VILEYLNAGTVHYSELKHHAQHAKSTFWREMGGFNPDTKTYSSLPPILCADGDGPISTHGYHSPAIGWVSTQAPSLRH